MSSLNNLEILNSVLYGDCFEWMPKIENKSIDAIICDMPFGTTKNKWDSVLPLDLLWNEYNRIIKDNGAIILFAQTPFDKVLGVSNLKMLRYEWIWEKDNATGHLNAKKMPMKKHENILIFYKQKPVYNPQFWESKPMNTVYTTGTPNNGNYGSFEKVPLKQINSTKRYPVSVIKFNTVNGQSKEKTNHPTQKPVELFEYLIRTYTNEGETVLDNCLGSGTTAVSCINTNRNFIGIEQDWNYCEIAKERVEKAKKLKTI